MQKIYPFVSAMLTALLIPISANAKGVKVDQVEKLEVEAGETELNTQFILARENGEDELVVIGTIENSVSDSLQFGIELEAERESGDRLFLDTVGLQFKWMAIDLADAPIGLGIQPSIQIDANTGKVGSETFFIAEALVGSFDLAVNIVVSTEPGDWSEATTIYAVRADRPLSDRILLGLEAGGGLSGDGAGGNFVGPVLSYRLGERLPELELSAFTRVSGSAPGFQLRIETRWEF